MPKGPSNAKKAILIINPNTTKSMTNALQPLVDSLHFQETAFSYFTATSGVPSINNEDDAAVSAQACLPALKEKLSEYDGFLVCCYSRHPLVALIRDELNKAGLSGKIVIGIFEASIATCLQAINVNSKFGIVSTGSQWTEILGAAMKDLLGTDSSWRYAGTETTGLNADEMHTTLKSDVDKRMKDATKRLLDKKAEAICLGCAGMVGLHGTVREACIEQLGKEAGERIMIVDGVVSGVLFLEGAWRAGL